MYNFSYIRKLLVISNSMQFCVDNSLQISVNSLITSGYIIQIHQLNGH